MEINTDNEKILNFEQKMMGENSMKNTSAAMERVLEVLKEDKLSYKECEDYYLLKHPVKDEFLCRTSREFCMVPLSIHLIDEQTLCFMLVPPRFKVDVTDEQKMARTAEFIVRANYELELESIQMDFDTGIISMRRTIEWMDKDVPSKELIRNAIRHMVYSYEIYAVGIIAVFMLNKEPSRAIKACWQNERNKGEFKRMD